MVKSRNIHKEMSLVERVLQTLISWGKNEMVVNVPATRPMTVIKSMRYPFFNLIPE